MLSFPVFLSTAGVRLLGLWCVCFTIYIYIYIYIYNITVPAPQPWVRVCIRVCICEGERERLLETSLYHPLALALSLYLSGK